MIPAVSATTETAIIPAGLASIAAFSFICAPAAANCAATFFERLIFSSMSKPFSLAFMPIPAAERALEIFFTAVNAV